MKSISFVNWTLGMTGVILGLFWLVFEGYGAIFVILIPVLPISIILVGLLIMGMEYNFNGVRVIPMTLMVVFTYECLVETSQNYLYLLTGTSNIGWAIYAQMGLALTGWILSGRPKFLVNKVTWIPFIGFVLFSSNSLYHIFESAFYLYAVMGGISDGDSFIKRIRLVLRRDV